MAEAYEMNDHDQVANAGKQFKEPAVVEAPVVNEINVVAGKIEVRRVLKDYHIIFITISGVLGAGLYTTSGTMLKEAGPGAVVTSFALMGALAVMVMQCIGELICIWPIPNALVQFVGAFVDPELGKIIGLAYWFAWAVSFQALITAAAQEGAYWFGNPADPQFLQIFLLYILPQFILLGLNALWVEVYGLLEVMGGTLKVLLLLIVIVFMGLLNSGFAGHAGTGASNFGTADSNFRHHPGLASDGVAFFMALSLCAYSFLGVEIPAVLATEATLRLGVDGKSRSPANAALKSSVALLPVLTAVFYFVAGLLVSLDVEWNDKDLPGLAWLSERSSSQASVFVIAAQEASAPYLGKMFTAFFVITAWSAANTALYVASRTLYGLTAEYADRPGQWGDQKRSLKDSVLGWLAHTNDTTKVPFTAAIVSFVLFFWIPYLQIWRKDSEATQVVLSTLQQMAAVCGVTVWMCACIAFIFFRHYAKKFARLINDEHYLPYLLRSRNVEETEYPWVSRGQPFVAYIAVLGCLVILIAGGSPVWNASIWNDGQQAAAALIGGYGPVIIIILLWIIMKWMKEGSDFRAWVPTRLEHWHTGFLPALEILHKQRKSAIESFRRAQQHSD